MHFIQRPRYQRGDLRQDPAGNRTARSPPDHRKEMQTEVVWTCLPFTRPKPSCQGTIKGGRRWGRQRKRWEDNIREWTGLELANSQKAVENREKWRKLAVKSSVVPQWPPRLRYRWRWRILHFLRQPWHCPPSQGALKDGFGEDVEKLLRHW